MNVSSFFSHLSSSSRIYLALAISYGLTVVIAVILHFNISLFSDTQAQVDHTMRVEMKNQAILLSLVNMETGLRGYAVGGAETFLDPFNGGKDEFAKNLADIRKLVQDPAQLERLHDPSTKQGAQPSVHWVNRRFWERPAAFLQRRPHPPAGAWLSCKHRSPRQPIFACPKP